MFHYNVFIILAIVANALTNPIVNQPVRCCFPNRYSFKTGYTYRQTLPDGTISATHMKYDFAYDAERGFLAIRGTMQFEPENSERSFWTIDNLKNGDSYSIDVTQNTSQGKEAAIFANSSIDAYDGKNMVVDTWIIQDNDYIYYAKVRRDDCLPLESGYSMTNQGISSLKTSDILKDIADPTIFQIPSSCH